MHSTDKHLARKNKSGTTETLQMVSDYNTILLSYSITLSPARQSGWVWSFRMTIIILLPAQQRRWVRSFRMTASYCYQQGGAVAGSYDFGWRWLYSCQHDRKVWFWNFRLTTLYCYQQDRLMTMSLAARQRDWVWGCRMTTYINVTLLPVWQRGWFWSFWIILLPARQIGWVWRFRMTPYFYQHDSEVVL